MKNTDILCGNDFKKAIKYGKEFHSMEECYVKKKKFEQFYIYWI